MRVSVTEYEDDAFLERERPAEIDSPKESNRMSSSFSEEYFKLEERRFHEAAEKVILINSGGEYLYFVSLDHEAGTESDHSPERQQTEQLCLVWVGDIQDWRVSY